MFALQLFLSSNFLIHFAISASDLVFRYIEPDSSDYGPDLAQNIEGLIAAEVLVLLSQFLRLAAEINSRKVAHFFASVRPWANMIDDTSTGCACIEIQN